MQSENDDDDRSHMMIWGRATTSRYRRSDHTCVLNICLQEFKDRQGSTDVTDILYFRFKLLWNPETGKRKCRMFFCYSAFLVTRRKKREKEAKHWNQASSKQSPCCCCKEVVFIPQLKSLLWQNAHFNESGWHTHVHTYSETRSEDQCGQSKGLWVM